MFKLTLTTPGMSSISSTNSVGTSHLCAVEGFFTLTLKASFIESPILIDIVLILL